MPSGGGLPVGCLAGQVPEWNGTAWNCAENSGESGYEGPLASGSKTGMDCALENGTPYEISAGTYVCYFPRNLLKAEVILFIPTGEYSCPDGWTQYQNWTKTSANGCSGCSSCTTGSHNFSNTARESCTYNGRDSDKKCTGNTSCRASIQARGCV